MTYAIASPIAWNFSRGGTLCTCNGHHRNEPLAAFNGASTENGGACAEYLHPHVPPGEAETSHMIGNHSVQGRTPPYVKHMCKDKDTGHGCPSFQTS